MAAMRTSILVMVTLLANGACALYGEDGGDDGDSGSGQLCGGLTGRGCPSDEFCDYPVEHACGIADGGGACHTRPSACPENYAPVIGSDGQRYDNACFAHAAGADDCEPAPAP